MNSTRNNPQLTKIEEMPNLPTCEDCGMQFRYTAMVWDHKRKEHGFEGDSPRTIYMNARMLKRRQEDEEAARNEEKESERYSLGEESRRHSSAPSMKKPARSNKKAGPQSAPAKLTSRAPMRSVSKASVESNKSKRRTVSSSKKELIKHMALTYKSTPRNGAKNSGRATSGAAPQSAPKNIQRILLKSPIEKNEIDRSSTCASAHSTAISSKNILRSSNAAENTLLKEDEEAVKKEKLDDFFKNRVIKYLTEAENIGFNNIFDKEEIDTIKQSCMRWKGIHYTMPTEKCTKKMIDAAVKTAISECMTQVISKRRLQWSQEFERFAKHCSKSFSNAPYRFAIAMSADCKTLVYHPFINKRSYNERELSDQEEKEVVEANKIIKDNWIHDSGRVERESFVKVKTLANPEYFIAISILNGSLDSADKELWKKNGAKTLKVLSNIRPNQMHQWILHRMRKKEVPYIKEEGFWLTIFAETAMSREVNIILKTALRTTIGE